MPLRPWFPVVFIQTARTYARTVACQRFLLTFLVSAVYCRWLPNRQDSPHLLAIREFVCKMLEARGGIEPPNKGFADLCLTTWLPRRAATGQTRAFLEARTGVEPVMEVLQTSALPLGYRADLKDKTDFIICRSLAVVSRS